MTNVTPDLSLDRWVHLHLIYGHGDELVEDQGYFLSLVLVSVLAESGNEMIVVSGHDSAL